MNQLPQTEVQQYREQAVVLSKAIAVVDQSSFDRGIDLIRRCKEHYELVGYKFKPILDPLKEALTNANKLVAELVDNVKLTEKQQRLICTSWMDQERKRQEAEQLAALEAQKEQEPFMAIFDAPPEPVKQVVTSSNGGSLKKKPWDVRIDDENALWEATLKDPPLRAYWTPNLGALKAKAKSDTTRFSIPGCTAFQGSTLAVK